MTKSILIFMTGLIFLAFSCNNVTEKEMSTIDSTVIQGDLMVFYAGSMTYPMKEIISEFENEYPYVSILSEASGSRTAARKVLDLGRKCDVLISSDYQVIKSLMIPNYAKWYIEFASNEMVIAFSDKSRKSDIINQENWYKILLDEDVRFGRADPDSDPCGYRSVVCIKLAEIYYGEDGVKDKLLFKDKKQIRPKDTDLIASMDAQEIDYMFIYKSVALQFGFRFIELPNQINLKSSELASYYSMASMKVSGKTPGNYIVRKGDPIRYALTIVNNAPNPRAAEAFLSFFINRDQGLKILTKNKMAVLDSLRILPLDSVTMELQNQWDL